MKKLETYYIIIVLRKIYIKKGACNLYNYKKAIMNKKKIIIAAGSSLTVLATIATATFFAIFQSGQKTETSLTTGVINVDLVESFTGSNGDKDYGTNPDKDGLENATKVITGVNTGTQPAYVRVKIFPQVESLNTDDEWEVDGAVATNYVKYDQSNDGWVDGGDGYWYYTKKLPAGETTPPITITNLRLDMPDVIASINNWKTFRVNMLVELEATQASNDLYKLNWGIDKLPSSVEQ